MPYITSFERVLLQKGREEGEPIGLEKGREEGRSEGREEGQLLSSRQVLQQILEKRFGSLPDAAKDRVASADLASLHRWIESALDAPELQQVWGE